MKRALELILVLFQLIGNLLVELFERNLMRGIVFFRYLLSRGLLPKLDSLHQLPWWVKTLVSLLGLTGLGWFYF